MKNNLTKRFLAAAIAAASMLQGAAFAAIVTPTADTTIVNTDFEDGVPANFLDGTYTYEKAEEGYNQVMVPPTGSGYARYASFGATSGKSKIMLSFDYKYNSDADLPNPLEIIKVRLLKATSGTADMNLFVSGGRINAYDGTDWSNLPNFVKNKWYAIDMLVDITAGTVKTYVDGDLFAQTSYSDGITAIQNIYIKQGQTVYFDNFRLSEYNGTTPIYAEKYEYAQGDKYVKVRYSESLDADKLDLTKIKLVNTCTGLNEKSGDAILAGRTLFVPVKEFSFDTEYALCLPEGTTSITGKSVANLNDYFTVETASGDVPEIAVKRVSEDFEGERKYFKGDKVTVIDTEDEKHGKALKVAKLSSNFETAAYAKYDLKDMTQKAVIKFDINFTKIDTTDNDYYYKLVSRSKTPGGTNSDTQLLGWKGFGFSGKYKPISEKCWYTVTLLYDYQQGTVDGWLNDVSFGRQSVEVGAYPAEFHLLARLNEKQEYLIDNFQVGTVAEKAKVANVRINKDSDAYGVCDLAPVSPSNITVNFTDAVLAETITSETVTLKTSDGAAVNAAITAGADGTSAVITPAVELKSNTTYYVFAKGVQTAGGNTVAEYGTSFTTETAEFKVTSFGLLNGDGDAAADFDSITLAGNAGSAYARATIQNDFGVAKTANIIFALYQGDKMVNISLTPVMVPAGETKTIGIADNISYEVPSDPTGYTLKAFIWNMADGNIASMFENVVIDK